MRIHENILEEKINFIDNYITADSKIVTGGRKNCDKYSSKLLVFIVFKNRQGTGCPASKISYHKP